jgi:hypothetical protein
MQHESHNNDLTELFEKWLEGETLSPAEMQRLKGSAHFTGQIAMIESMQSGQVQMENTQVPKWDKDATFVDHSAHSQTAGQSKGWFGQINGMSLAAMTFSVIACGLLFLNLNNMHAANAQQQQLIAQNIQQQLTQWSEHNQQVLTNTITTLQQQQQESSIKLANYLMENSRLERQEDLQRVVNIMQDQRQEDLRFVHAELSDMQYKLQVTALNARNADNLNNPNSLNNRARGGYSPLSQYADE